MTARIYPVALKLISIVLLLSMFLKAVIEVRTDFDSWWYHLPWAANLWGIVTTDHYIWSDHLQDRFSGFPLLVEFLQGFFWYLTGRPEGANLVCLLSLILYLIFLRSYFRIPIYLSSIALLAIPLVQTHATSTYVDLPANLALSILFLMTYRLYINDNLVRPRDLLLMFGAAVFAAHAKFQAIPFVFILGGPILYKVIWVQYRETCKEGNDYTRLSGRLFAALFVGLLVFAVPVKNIILYKNPFYPFKFEVVGITLNHTQAFTEKEEDTSQATKWVQSVLELKSLPWNDPRRWTVDQANRRIEEIHRMGGFFGLYVVFHIGLLAYLCYRLGGREPWFAAAAITLAGLVNSVMPNSHLLRYYMFWMISLVSLNLFLIYRLDRSIVSSKWINRKSVAGVVVVALMFVIWVNKGWYVRPRLATLTHLNSFENLVDENVKPKVLAHINDGDKVCLPQNFRPWAFLYTSLFHGSKNYVIKQFKEPNECTGFRIFADITSWHR